MTHLNFENVKKSVPKSCPSYLIKKKIMNEIKNLRCQKLSNSVSYSNAKFEGNRLNRIRVIVGNMLENHESRKMHLNTSLLTSISPIFLRISTPTFQETFITYQTLKIRRNFFYLVCIFRYMPPLKCLKNSPRK